MRSIHDDGNDDGIVVQTHGLVCEEVQDDLMNLCDAPDIPVPIYT